MVPVPQALRTVLRETAAILYEYPVASEHVATTSPSIIGRISCETIKASQEGYPPYNASIMDGYAINTQELKNFRQTDNSTIKRFQIVKRIHAGTVANDSINNSSTKEHTSLYKAMSIITNENLSKAIYVTTGAVVPPPYDTVIPVEDVDEYVSNKVIAIAIDVLSRVSKNSWIRKVGCDIPPYTPILKNGETIQCVHVGLLIQCGVKIVQVHKRPIIGVLSTGNEVFSIDEMDEFSTSLGMVPDANGPVLTSLLTSYHSCQVINLGIANDDDVDHLSNILKEAISKCDAVITSGGVSMGEKDIIEKVLVENLQCRIHFGRLHMKPGKPTTFATATYNENKKCLIFAMPGNPVSAFVCTELLVRPCLDMLSAPSPTRDVTKMVQDAKVHAEVFATLTVNVRLDVERPEYLRVSISSRFDDDGTLSFDATPTGVQRSSRLMSMCDADGLMVMPQGIKGGKVVAETGEIYPVLLLRRSLGNAGFLDAIKFKNSLHIQSSSLAIGILEIQGESQYSGRSSTEEIKSRIANVLDGSLLFIQTLKTSDVSSVSNMIHSMSKSLDVILVICTNTLFQVNLHVADILRSHITKTAPLMAFQARQGAASENPTLALFENVAGFCNNDGKACIILSIPNEGVVGALSEIKGLLRKAVVLSSGG